ncbi:MAG: YjbH domain-containing protein [Rhizomicrobium sp.]
MLLGAAALCVATITGASCAVAGAVANSNDRTTYGDPGILEMPSARMDPDGTIFFTVGAVQGAQRFNFSFQALPWLQASFRYSHLASIGGIKNEFDRSFGIKVRLVQESSLMPDISLGIRDILGTGIYSSEYLTATKQFSTVEFTAGLGWGRLSDDATIPNVFAVVFPSFKDRRPFGATGAVNFGEFFHGPDTGVFAGAIWHTPIDNLNVLAEFSTDKYRGEQGAGTIKIRSPVNLGLSYRFFDSAAVSLGWLYGTTYGATFTLSADPTIPLSVQRLAPELPPPNIRSPQQQVASLTELLGKNVRTTSGPWVTLPSATIDRDNSTISSALMSIGLHVRDVELAGRTLLVNADLASAPKSQCDGYARLVANLEVRVDTIALSDLDGASGQVTFCNVVQASETSQAASPAGNAEIDETSDAEMKIRRDVAAQSIRIEALAIQQSVIWLFMNNYHYRSEDEAAGRIARILMADAPSTVEIMHIVSVKNGIPMRDFQISRNALERSATVEGGSAELGNSIALLAPPLSNPVLDRAFEDSYPRFSWNLGPGLREGLFDPDQPLEVQIYASLEAAMQLTPNITLDARLEANIYNNFNLSRPSNSLLPHVRSDIISYLRDGSDGVTKLDFVYRTRLARDVTFEARAGYLEQMFAGAGAQALWRPDGGRIALGVDVYQVWQRDFDELYGLQKYHILTGHVSVYYNSPWYGLNFAVHGGRYLAGDYGATFEVTRRFSTGVEIGAFATFTNVPFSKFGEGSFDKGLIIHIPLEWSLPFPSQSSIDFLLRSLTRDGGQRLDSDDSLIKETDSTSFAEDSSHLDDIVSP